MEEIFHNVWTFILTCFDQHPIISWAIFLITAYLLLTLLAYLVELLGSSNTKQNDSNKDMLKGAKVTKEEVEEFNSIKSKTTMFVIRRMLYAVITCERSRDYCFDFLKEYGVGKKEAEYLIENNLTPLPSVRTGGNEICTFKFPDDAILDIKTVEQHCLPLLHVHTGDDGYSTSIMLIPFDGEELDNVFINSLLLGGLRQLEEVYNAKILCRSPLSNWGIFSGKGFAFYGVIHSKMEKYVFGKLFYFKPADVNYSFIITAMGVTIDEEECTHDENGNVVIDEVYLDRAMKTEAYNLYALMLIEHSFRLK